MKFIVLALLLVAISANRVIPEFEINMDLPLEQRYAKVIATYNTSAIEVYNSIFGKLGVLKDALYEITLLRGKENPEL